jgi:hypothetical protein
MSRKSAKEENKAVLGGASTGPFKRDHVADPSDLILGLLWIQLQDGSFVNAASHPEEFDKAVAEHVEFFDRVNWPTVHRSKILQENTDIIPVFRVEPGDLPPGLHKIYEEIEKPEEISEEELTES